MRTIVTGSAVLGIAMTAIAAPALAEGRIDGRVPMTAYAAGQFQRIDVEAFIRKLRKVKGLGLLTKIKLGAQINRIAEDFYWFHKGKSAKRLAEMRARFDVLHNHIAGLIWAKNPDMHAMFVRSREALWRAFADRGLYTAGFGRKVIKRIEGREPQFAADESR